MDGWEVSHSGGLPSGISKSQLNASASEDGIAVVEYGLSVV